MATTTKKPWEVAGLSKSTYYRREEEKRLAAEGKAPVKRGRPPQEKSASRSAPKSMVKRTWTRRLDKAVAAAEEHRTAAVTMAQPLEQNAAVRAGIDIHPADRVMVDQFLATYDKPGLIRRFDSRGMTGIMFLALITVLKFHGYGPDPDGN